MRRTLPIVTNANLPARGNEATRSTSRPQEACLVRIYPAGLSGSRIHLADDHLLIGRSPSCQCEIHDEHASRQHARIDQWEGRHRICDLGSTNGTFVNDQRIEQHLLTSGDQIRVGHHIFKYLCSDHVEAMYHEAVFQMMTTDALTQTYNRLYFEDAFEREVLRATRYGRQLGMLILDIDHFKQINDQLGHLVGDDVLTAFCRRIKRRIRADELFARIGGEEFALLVVEISRSELERLARSLLSLVSCEPFEIGKHLIPLSVSIGGVHTYGKQPITARELWDRADARLYEAKRAGRNRVSL